MKILLDHGVVVDTQNLGRLTPVCIVRKHRFKEIVPLVVDYVLEELKDEFKKLATDKEVSAEIKAECNPEDVEMNFKEALESDMATRLAVLESSTQSSKGANRKNKHHK